MPPSTPTAKAAASFIRDLYYNPTLRDQYYTALGLRTDALREAALTKLLQNYNKNCTYQDLGDGWKVLTQQSLLAWQSIYELQPLGLDPNADKTVHTCMVAGSRTGQSTILFDNVAIIGYKSDFPNSKTVTWDVSSSNAPLNASISFDYKKLADPTVDPSTGPRIMNVKLWKKGDPEPTAFTHSGHDFFEDIAKFNGKYNTTLVDPDSGDESTGSDVAIDIDQSVVGANSAKIGVTVIADDGVTKVPIAKSLDSLQNTVNWTKDANSTTSFTDGDVAAWQQGWLNFSWQYVPAVQKSDGSLGDPGIIQQMQGSIWTDSMGNSQQVIGTIIPDTAVGDNDSHKAYVVGLVVSIGLFAVLGIGIALGIRKLYKWIQEKRANAAKAAKGDKPTDKDISSEKSSIEGSKLDRNVLPKEAQKTSLVDPNDSTTFERELSARGDKIVSYRGQAVYKNPLDPTGKTAIANLTKPGEPVPSKELVKSDGAALDTSLKIPTLKSPIKNIETQVEMSVGNLGGQFVTGVKVGDFVSQEVLTKEGGNLKDSKPVEIV